jgi:hypothetical protein
MRPEDRAQSEIFTLLAWLAPSVVAYAIPNSSRRTRTGKASNAVPGLRPGVWDIAMILPMDCDWPGRTAYCEVKAATGRLSKEQVEFGAMLESRGVPHFIAKAPNHLDHVRRALRDWRVKTREAGT